MSESFNIYEAKIRGGYRDDDPEAVEIDVHLARRTAQQVRVRMYGRGSFGDRRGETVWTHPVYLTEDEALGALLDGCARRLAALQEDVERAKERLALVGKFINDRKASS